MGEKSYRSRSFLFLQLRIVGLVVAAELAAHAALLAFGLPAADWGAGLLRAALLAILSAPLIAWSLTRRSLPAVTGELNCRLPDDPTSGLRWMTLTGLGLVASLGLATYTFEQKAARSTATHSRLMNLAGRQRMLSQRIARFAINPPVADSQHLEERLAEISRCLQEIHENFDVLNSTAAAETVVEPERMRLTALSLNSLGHAYDRLTQIARSFLTASREREPTTEALLLTHAADQFMAASHETVLALHRDFEAYLFRQDRWRLAIGLLLAATVVGVYVLLIDPAIRQLRAQQRFVHARTAELQRLALVAQMTSDAVLIADAMGQIVWANESWTRISGMSTNEALERSVRDLLAEQGCTQADLSEIGRALRQGVGSRNELCLTATDGAKRWVDVEFQPLAAGAGKQSGYIVVLSDITSQRDNQTRLQEQIRHLEEAEESARMGHWSWDLATGAGRWSRQIFRIHGLEEAAEPPALPAVFSLYTPDAGKQLRAAIDRALTTGDEYKLVLQTSAGQEQYLEIHGYVRRNADYAICGLHGTLRDVTDRVLSDRARTESEERYRQLADSIPAMTWLSGPDTNVTDFNKSWLEFRGRPLEAELGDGWTDGLHPEDLLKTLDAYHTAFNARTPYATTYRLLRSDGVYRWIEARGVPRYAATGEFLGYAGGCVDMTDLKESQQQLRESERLLEQTGAAAGVGGWELDLATQEVRWTDQTCRIHEVPLDYKPTLDEAINFYTPEARPLIRAAVERGILTGDGWDLELPFVTATGRSIWVRAVGQVEFRDGQAARLHGAFQDVTRRKTAELEVIRATALIHGVLDAASEFSIIATDPQGLITVFNRGAERLLGYSGDEMIGRRTPVVIHAPEEVEQRQRELAREFGRPIEGFRLFVEVAEREGIERRDWTYVRKDGSRFPVSLTVSVIRTGQGETVGYLGIAEDISARRCAEESLLESNRRLEAANRRAEEMATRAAKANESKSEFLASMSHEIRTPMTAILGFADLLAGDAEPPLSREQRQDYVATIRRNGEHLLTLINDILDMSKIEAGKMTIERVVTEPARIVDEVRELMLVKAQARGVELDVICRSGLPATLETDPVRLKQILVNLVGNAIKFTDRGRVTMTVGLDDDGTRGPFVRFDVEDTGIGMTAEQVGRLFSAFQQADTTTTRKFGGTGLGLRISRRLVELLGGEITVHSQPGVGSTFTVRIATVLSMADRPASLPETPAAVRATDRARPLAGARILFVEDGPDNQRLISFFLRKAGAEIRMFENGRLALESLTTDGSIDGPLAADLQTDVILTDMQMPEMDGYTLIRTLRLKGCTLPIVALTANAMGGDREKCLEVGCDHYASKPINQTSLIELLQSACESRTRNATSR